MCIGRKSRRTKSKYKYILNSEAADMLKAVIEPQSSCSNKLPIFNILDGLMPPGFVRLWLLFDPKTANSEINWGGIYPVKSLNRWVTIECAFFQEIFHTKQYSAPVQFPPLKDEKIGQTLVKLCEEFAQLWKFTNNSGSSSPICPALSCIT